jgi:hypothetical protein
MSNKSQITIALVSLLVITTSGIFILSKTRPAENPSVSVASSSASSLVSSSLKSVLSSSSQLVSSSSQSEVAKLTEVPKVENVPVVVKPNVDLGSNPNPVQDIPNVTKLSTDKSIYHQYIRDYLACPTKFYQTLNGGYIFEGLDQYQYTCIPKSEADNCPSKTLIYGLKPLVGKKVMIIDGTGIPFNPNSIISIQANKFYCANFYETNGSVSLGEISGYGQSYAPTGVSKDLPGYFTIPKSKIPSSESLNETSLSFASIPLESFSKEDQQYISKNFILLPSPSYTTTRQVLQF